MQKPKYVMHGTYGCVFKPSMSCKGDETNSSKVSKVFSEDDEAKSEKQIHKSIVDKVDPTNRFTVALFDYCNVKRSSFPSSEFEKCDNIQDYYQQNFKQLVYEYGGKDLYTAARECSFEELFVAFKRIFEGLCLLEKQEFLHNDIKPPNIVYNSLNKKMSLIDFGLITKFRDAYHEKSNFKHTHPYAYYPPEYQACAYYFDNKIHFINDIAKDKPYKTNLRYMDKFRDIDTLIRSHFLSMSSSHHADIDKFLKAWDSLETIKTNNFLDFIDAYSVSKKSFNNYLSDFVNKIDVYMLGVTLYEIFYLSFHYRNMTITKDKLTFYTAVLKLISDMIETNPLLRLDPTQAYSQFKKVVELLGRDVMESPKAPSPIKKIRRKDDKPSPNIKSSKSNGVKTASKEKKTCPPGKVVNPLTGRCKKIEKSATR